MTKPLKIILNINCFLIYNLRKADKDSFQLLVFYCGNQSRELTCEGFKNF